MMSSPSGFELQRDMCESALVAAGIGWLSRASADAIVRRFEESEKRVMPIDGAR
jgi:hypothetical protein